MLPCYAVGFLWLLSSTFALDHFSLFGITQGTGFNMMEKLGCGLKEKELCIRLHYKIVRHPIMTGFFTMFFAVPHMTLNHLFFSVSCSVYILLAVKLFEEPDLKKVHEQEYEDYCKKIPAYVPFMPMC